MTEITKEVWEDAVSNWVVIILWTPKPNAKRQIPTVKVAGDYPTRAKAIAVKKKLEKRTGPSYDDDRRTIYVARKFDVNKLDLFDTYYWPTPEEK